MPPPARLVVLSLLICAASPAQARPAPPGYDLFMRVENGERVYMRGFPTFVDCERHAARVKKMIPKLTQALDLEHVEMTCEAR